jgi:3-oxoacyl-[acyl-carrier protein] reductase
MDLGLKGRRALVLGASRGLGAGIAAALAAEGAQVAAASRRSPDWPVDMGETASVTALHQRVTERLGPPEVLVLNGGGPPFGGAQGIDPAVWRAQFEAQVLSPVHLADLCLPAMKAAGWGRILVVASSGVVQPIPNLALSNALRSALVGWCKTLASEVAAQGVTVNILLPGRIQTDRVDELDSANAARSGSEVETVKAAARSQIPAGRYGKVEEFAAVAAFLASDAAAFMTGGMVRIDGGQIRSV